MSIEAPDRLNGRMPAESDTVRIRFGDLANQTLPLEWAERFIQIVYAEHPQVFRAILPRLYGLPEPEPKRTRRPS